MDDDLVWSQHESEADDEAPASPDISVASNDHVEEAPVSPVLAVAAQPTPLVVPPTPETPVAVPADAASPASSVESPGSGVKTMKTIPNNKIGGRLCMVLPAQVSTPFACQCCEQTFKTKQAMSRHMTSKVHNRIVAFRALPAPLGLALYTLGTL